MNSFIMFSTSSQTVQGIWHTASY